ncbi:MAG: RDD family protein [Acidimicrobiia bacterium]
MPDDPSDHLTDGDPHPEAIRPATPLEAVRGVVRSGVGAAAGLGRRATGLLRPATGSNADPVVEQEGPLDERPGAAPASHGLPVIESGRELAARVIDDTTRAATRWMVSRVDLESIVIATSGSAFDRGLTAIRSMVSKIDTRVDALLARVLRRPVASPPPDVVEQIVADTPEPTGLDPDQIAYGGLAGRAIALGVDATSVVVGYYGLVGVAVLVRALAGLRAPSAPDAEPWVWAVTFSVWAAAYLALCWRLAGRTAGQALLGLRVVTTRGQRLGMSRAALRVVGYPLSLALFGIGFAWAGLSTRRRCWADYLAGTCVISAPTHPRELTITVPDSSPR